MTVKLGHFRANAETAPFNQERTKRMNIMMPEEPAVKIAGVTFNNKDGESRQEILKELSNRPSYVTLEPEIFHNPETGLGEFAIRVVSETKKKTLGYIPKKEINSFKNTGRMLLIAGQYKNSYFGCLYMIKDPTPKQYGLMKSLYRKGRINAMPLYDQTIYGMVLDSVMAQNRV